MNIIEVWKLYPTDDVEREALFVLHRVDTATEPFTRTIIASLTEREANDLISSLGIAIADRTAVT